MKFTEGAFRNWGYEVARDEFGDVTITEDELYSVYGGVQPEGKIVIKDRIADIIFQLLQLRPAEFSVLATLNLNGDYLSDAAAAHVGGVGIAPGANIADYVAVFEATHGTAPKYANLDKVNPGSLLLSGVMMLEYMGWQEAADLINSALTKVVADKTVTYDFARQMPGATEVKTSQFGDLLIAKIRGETAALVAAAEAHRAQVEAEKSKLEEQRQANPAEAMKEAGRQPHAVADIMHKVVTVKGTESVAEVMHMMRESRISSVVVEPDDKGEWGIMTQSDIMRKIINANRSPARVVVNEIVNRPLVMVSRDTTLTEASSKMLEANIRRVVVGASGTPIGVVSDMDLFRTVEEYGWGGE